MSVYIYTYLTWDCDAVADAVADAGTTSITSPVASNQVTIRRRNKEDTTHRFCNDEM